jgi:hypothetical protein
MNECFNCGYHYQGENDRFPCCHFDGFGLAPCEYEDEDEEDEDIVDVYTYDDLGYNWY